MGNNENSNDKLDALKNFENNLNVENNSIKLFDEKNSETVSKIEEKENEEIIDNENSEEFNNIPFEVPVYETVNGYRILANESLPYEGKLYPSTWKFSYRCPTTDEVAEFSTIDERDTPKIQDAITNLIKKCYVIVDVNEEKQISSSQINDGDRLFFFLKLREYYMQDIPIEFPIISQNFQEPLQVNLMAHNLIFKPIKDKLLECYNGRKWSISVEKFGLKEPIVFLNPTLEISQRIFKYMVNKYREANDQKKEKLNKDEFDRKFLLLLPFLYDEGNEKIESLHLKYKSIQKNEKLLKAYLTIATKMIHTNEEYLIINYQGEEEKTDIKFPGGWKNIFIDNKSFEDLFN